MHSFSALILLLPLLVRAACPADRFQQALASSEISKNARTSNAIPSSPASVAPSSALGKPSGVVPPPPVASDCSCGYILSEYDDAYFPLSHNTNFGSLPSGRLTVDQLEELGWQVAQGWQAGGIGPQDTIPMGDINTFSALDGVLHMTVPGGYSLGGEIPSSEITFSTDDGVTGGVFTMQALLSDTEGTCQSLFTYRKDNAMHDEQDIEILGQSIKKPMPNGTPAGIQLTNWDPSQSKNDNRIVPFPTDPTAAFHNYTIAWLPGSTKYYFDGGMLGGPTKYSSIHPSEVMINHWSSGNPGWTAGPPVEDVTLKVKSVTLYYQTPKVSGLPPGCTKEQACRV